MNKYMKGYKDDGSLEWIKTIDYTNKAVSIFLELKDGKLLTTSIDGTVNIYKKDSYEIDFSIKEHSDEIYSVIQLSDEMIVTCSRYSLMKVIKLSEDNKYVVESTLKSNDAVFIQLK
jgi:WD40 repeat protein